MDRFFIDGFRMIVIMSQILIPIFLIAFSYSKRSHFILRAVLLCTIALVVVFFVQSPNVENKYLRILTNSLYFYAFFIVANLITFFCYRIDFRSSVVITIIAYTLQHLCYLIFNMFDQIILDHFTLSGVWSYVFIRRLLVTFLLIPISYAIGLKIKKKPEILLPSAVVFGFSLVATLSDIVISNAPVGEELSAPLSANVTFYAIRLFNILLCVLILTTVFTRVEQSRIEQEIEVIQKLNEEKSRLYEINKETIELINYKVHDFKHQLHELSSSGKVVSAEAIAEINDTLHLYDTRLKTGRDALDVVLQEKGLLCLEFII